MDSDPRRDDLASTDEVKVYTEEGDDEAENLSEDKIGLVKESEQVFQNCSKYIFHKLT